MTSHFLWGLALCGRGRGREGEGCTTQRNIMPYTMQHTFRLSCVHVGVWLWGRTGTNRVTLVLYLLWGSVMCGRVRGGGRVHHATRWNVLHDASHIVNIMHTCTTVIMRDERCSWGWIGTHLPLGISHAREGSGRGRRGRHVPQIMPYTRFKSFIWCM